jgi:hypothetical protein
LNGDRVIGRTSSNDCLDHLPLFSCPWGGSAAVRFSSIALRPRPGWAAAEIKGLILRMSCVECSCLGGG